VNFIASRDAGVVMTYYEYCLGTHRILQ